MVVARQADGQLHKLGSGSFGTVRELLLLHTELHVWWLDMLR